MKTTVKTKITSVESSAIELAVNFYLKGDGLTHAVKMANAMIAELAVKSNKGVHYSMMLANHQLLYRVKKDGTFHHYNKILTPAQIKTIKVKRDRGFTLKQLALEYGVSPATIRNYSLS